MDENKKNEVLDEETSQETVEDEKSVKDRANEILSGLNKTEIPDAVQDWDGVLPEVESSIELIDNEDVHVIDEVEEEEEIPEEELCVCCGKRRRCTSIAEDYEYCAQCRIDMLKTPFNTMGIIAVVLVCIVSIIGTFVLAPNALAGISTLMGYMIEKNGEVDAAIDSYSETLMITGETGLPVPMTVVERLATLANESYGPSDAEERIKIYLNSYQIEKSKVLSEIVKEHERIVGTSSVCNEAIREFYHEDTSTIDAEESYAALDKVIADNPGVYDEDMITYYKSNVALLDGDKDKEIAFLEEIRKKSPEKYWLYNEGNSLIDAYMRKGDFDKATEIADSIIAKNKTHQEANWSKAQILLMKGDKAAAEKIADDLAKINSARATAVSIEALIARLDKDYEKAIDLCTVAIDDDYYNSETYHQLLIAMVLNNDSETAYGITSEYYSYLYSNPQTTNHDYVRYINTYALLTYLEDEEQFSAVKDHYASQGAALPFPEELEQYAEKKITLEEIFLKGDFDL
ncbi:MAG: tetratricopeptide repeat protein [Clostridia bacterium]|nr:tetratricopeptide repeat protein [Clostridia bacterium]MBQ6708667.1 tetratricopeptide repeat protein [Clostridia bacterium]